MQEFDVTINYSLCIQCEECLDACDENVFEMDEEEQSVKVVHAQNCNGCNNCKEVCAPQAIYVGESIEKMSSDMKKYREVKANRKNDFIKLLESSDQDESGDYIIPVDIIKKALQFTTVDDLDNWLLYLDDFIAFRDEDIVIISVDEIGDEGLDFN
ncbi:MAG: ferredoxin family protein [Candidatus Thorarchaeota archaeon]